MKILVSGGAEFIGSAVIRQYNNDTAHEVVDLVALTYAGNLQSLSSGVGNSDTVSNMQIYTILNH